MRTGLLLAILFTCIAGCGTTGPADAKDIVLLVPGVGGNLPQYGGLRDAIRKSRPDTRIETFTWGAPLPLFVLNFSAEGIHQGAEENLARKIAKIPPNRRVSIIGHSAGCGVTLGALALLKQTPRVSNVILLAPSVSPQYDVRPALPAVIGKIHVFFSHNDDFYLSWRTSTFGTYDGIKSKAAGNLGFDLSSLTPAETARVMQHEFNPQWESLGNDGSHYGCLSGRFAAQVLVPLLWPTASLPQ